MVIKQQIYDGSLIHTPFAYKFLRDKVSATGDIVSFVSPMTVTTNLIDLEDSLNKDYIHSDEAFNFCWEIPNLCSFGAVAFQRLFITNVGNILFGFLQKDIFIDGDDIMVKDDTYKKASVSITYSKNNLAIGHLGININAGRYAPSFAYSTLLSEENSKLFIEKVEACFYNMTKDIFVATS
jgi:hypothetical protein